MTWMIARSHVSKAALWATLTVLLLAALPCMLSAQWQALGVQPFGSFGGGSLDRVNLTSLNLHIHIPLIENPGRGLPFTYSLDYDGTIWQPELVNGEEVWTPPAGAWGWEVVTSGNGGSYSYSEVERSCHDRHNLVHDYDIYSAFGYVDPDGVAHRFSGSTSNPPGQTVCGGNGNSSFTSVTGDGSGYTMVVTDYDRAVVYSPTGEMLQPSGPGGHAAGPSVDRNGNEITSSTSNGTVTYTDTIGNQITASEANGLISSVTYPGPTGQSETVEVEFAPQQISTSGLYCAGGSAPGAYGPVTVELPFHIIFPNGEQYAMSYNADGAINALTLPSGGIIEYSYSPTGPGGDDYIFCGGGGWANLNRTTPAPSSEWQYSLAPGTVSGQMVTTITNSTQASKTVLTSMDGFETERDTYNTAMGAEARSVVTCYDGATSNCNTSGVITPVIQRDVFTTLGPPGVNALESETMTGYDGYGNETEREDYAFGAGAPGALLRRVTTTMDAALGYVRDLPAEITVDSGPSTPVVAETVFDYDQATPQPTSGVSNHVAAPGSRGNLTEEDDYTASSAYLKKTFTYLDTGQINTSTAPNGGVTTYNYDQCTYSLPGQITTPGNPAVELTWDCGGQRPASFTDGNGQTTTFAYSDLGAGGWQWRPTTVSGPDGTTTSTYDATETDSVHNFGASTEETTVCFDLLGRPYLDQHQEGQSSGDYDTIETTFDGLGRVIAVTAPAQSGHCAAPASPVTAESISYDSLDRPLEISNHDGGTVRYGYNQNDVIETLGPAPANEGDKTRQLEYDPLGRLLSVCELTQNGDAAACGQTNGGSGYITTYTYGPAGRLLGSREANTGITQARTAVYDWLGRKTQEVNPESGATNYVYDSDAPACAGETAGDTGSLVEEADANGNVSCFYHDTAGRLTSENYPSSDPNPTPNRYFKYGPGNSVDGVAMQNAAGQLAEAYTESGTTVETDEGFSYAADGRLTSVLEKTPNEAAYSQVSDGYAQNGVVNAISSNLAGLPQFAYTLDGEGRWYSVSATSGQSPLSNATYNFGGEPTQVTFGSGDYDILSYDAGLGQLTEFDSYVGTNDEDASLTWNANGTLARVATGGGLAPGTNCTLAHDDLARLQSVTCDPWTQDFSVDAFGNIATTTAAGGATLYQANYNHQTNRIADVGGASVTYDSDGDILSDPQHAYTWSANGRPLTIGDSTHAVSASYDALGRMVEFGTAGAYDQVVYGPRGRFAVTENGTTLLKAEIPLPGSSAAVYNASGLEFYRHAGWQGSGRLGSTPSRTLAFYQDYSPFGDLLTGTGATGREWAGIENEASANLYDAEMREFDSAASRWSSPDPLGAGAVDLTDPQTLNRYAYAENQPLEMTDPSGEFGASEAGIALGIPFVPGIGAVVEIGELFNSLFGGPPAAPPTPAHAQYHEYSGVNYNGALEGEVDGIPTGMTLPQAVPFLPVPDDTCDFGGCGSTLDGGAIAIGGETVGGAACVLTGVCEVAGAAAAVAAAAAIVYEGVHAGYQIYQAHKADIQQFDHVWAEVQRACAQKGKTLDRGHRRRLHDAISKQRYTPGEMIEIGKGMFGCD